MNVYPLITCVFLVLTVVNLGGLVKKIPNNTIVIRRVFHQLMGGDDRPGNRE